MMITCGYVDTPDGQIHYRVRQGSTAAVPIICFHQTASSSKMFGAFMAAWPGDQTIYALDTPDFGGSFETEGAPDMADYARYLAAAIDALGVSKAIFFGHHTGASVAVQMATLRPDLCEALAMVGPVTITPEEAEMFKQVYPKDFAPKADGSHLQKMWDYVCEIGPNGPLELHHREFVDTAHAWNGHIKVYSTIWDHDFSGQYQALSCPLLIMCSEQDVLWPIFERAREMRPDAAAVVLGGSNFQLDEVTREVVEAVSAFVQSAG